MKPLQHPARSSLWACALLLVGLFAGACQRTSSEAPFAPDGDSRAPNVFAAKTEGGAKVELRSNLRRAWRSPNDDDPTAEALAGYGIRFEWITSREEAVEFSFAIEDTANWSTFSSTTTEWPRQPVHGPPVLWFPTPGPHKFFVRVRDAGGIITDVVVADLEVFGGPILCPQSDEYALVVLDTDPGGLIRRGDLPTDYATQERALIDEWFDGFEYRVFETLGSEPPPPSLLDCASCLMWFHTSDVSGRGQSALRRYHEVGPNWLDSYLSSGGNLFLAGVRPSQAVRWLAPAGAGAPERQPYPVDFLRSLNDRDLSPHWLARVAAIGSIKGSVGAELIGGAPVALAKSCITAGNNPYPDLAFNPETTGNNGGFVYYDHGLQPHGVGLPAEVIYKMDGSSVPIGTRRMLGNRGQSTVILGFHPYFVDHDAFGDLLDAAMADFGEFPFRKPAATDDDRAP